MTDLQLSFFTLWLSNILIPCIKYPLLKYLGWFVFSWLDHGGYNDDRIPYEELTAHLIVPTLVSKIWTLRVNLRHPSKILLYSDINHIFHFGYFMMFWHLIKLAGQGKTAPLRISLSLEIAKGSLVVCLPYTNQPILR